MKKETGITVTPKFNAMKLFEDVFIENRYPRQITFLINAFKYVVKEVFIPKIPGAFVIKFLFDYFTSDSKFVYF